MFSLPPTGSLVSLTDGEAMAIIAPECGARLCMFRVGNYHVLRPASPEALAKGAPYGFSGFPLLPYSGPLFGDGFSFGGTFYPTGRNVPAEPSTTHGEGWIMSWSTLDRTAKSLSLRVDYQPGENAFPFAWRGEMTFHLEDAQLSVAMKLVNRDYRPMPAGMGLHPYFPKGPRTTLTFDATGLWPSDAPEAVRLGAGPIEAGLDFRQGQDVDLLVLDRCYEGWDGSAVLVREGRTTTIQADPVFGKLQIYDAWDYPYICVEPVTNANDGFNRAALDVPGHAVVTLAPGQSLAGVITIALN